MTEDERTAHIERLWRNGEDVGVTDDGVYIDADWPDEDGEPLFERGSELMDVWRWFDQRHPEGVHYLLYELD